MRRSLFGTSEDEVGGYLGHPPEEEWALQDDFLRSALYAASTLELLEDIKKNRLEELDGKKLACIQDFAYRLSKVNGSVRSSSQDIFVKAYQEALEIDLGISPDEVTQAIHEIVTALGRIKEKGHQGTSLKKIKRLEKFCMLLSEEGEKCCREAGYTNRPIKKC